MRQSGKTIGVQIRKTWVVNYGTINSTIAYGNKKLSDAVLNLKRFHEIVECIPDYLKSHLDPKQDVSNQREYEIKSNSNKITVLSTAMTEGTAEGVGRGLTIPIWWCDEFAFLRFNDTIYAAAAPALSRAAESAKENGTPYGKILSTTPNNRDTREGKFAFDILEKAVRFDETWYDETEEELKIRVKNDSKNNFVYIKYMYYDLGRDEEWLEEQKRELQGILLKIKRELLLEWPLTNDKSPFTEEQIESVNQYVLTKPLGSFYVLNNRYKFNIYSPMLNKFKKNWLISIDIGGGGGSDFTVFTIIDPMTKKICAVLKSNSMRTKEIIPITRELLSGFFPNAVIIPERNGLGIPIVDAMMDDPIIGRRLYYEIRDRVAEKQLEDPRVNKFAKVKKKVNVYGVLTEKNSRKKMFEIMMDIVDNEPYCITAPETFQDMKTLERKNGNRLEAQEGAHDDCIMSYLIGLYVLYYGKNVAKFVSFVGDFGDESEFGKVDRNDKINKLLRNIHKTRQDSSGFENTKTYQLMQKNKQEMNPYSDKNDEIYVPTDEKEVNDRARNISKLIKLGSNK